MSVLFEWDERKAHSNLQKHGVSFEEAISIFRDPNSLTIYDETHSDDEARYIDIGTSIHGRTLVVVYTETNKRIRIIGARRATIREQEQYARRS